MCYFDRKRLISRAYFAKACEGLAGFLSRWIDQKEEFRAMTNNFGVFDKAVMIPSVNPSLKYFLDLSSLMLTNGRTIMEGLSGRGKG
jgi:hypothetical protein